MLLIQVKAAYEDCFDYCHRGLRHDSRGDLRADMLTYVVMLHY